ncbi:MAG: twin-arginine translocation pathway signal protein, partial [Bacteroidetes bacterium]|nr:twin-arginine translocation pathway signal protein [Bacteroidota bacterium]
MPDFLSVWPKTQRTFVGPEYWANRLQDWQVNQGRVECLVSQENRNLHLLTWDVNADTGTLSIQVRAGLMNEDQTNRDWNWVGFRLGIQGEFNDFRDNAIYGKGLDVGVTTRGELFIGDPGEATASSPLDYMGEMDLRIDVKSVRSLFTVTLSVHDPITGKVWESIQKDSILNRQLTGNIALVSHFEDMGATAETPSVWFADWAMSGSKLVHHPERAYGPIMFSHYTLSEKIMKMTAQMAPTGERDAKVVELQIKEEEEWKTLGEAAIHKLARTATFKIQEWDDSKDTPYRLVYKLFTADNMLTPYYWEGTIRKNPIDQKELVVAGFTGNNDLGFPNKDLTDNVVLQNPDVLFFSGDQIYEGVGGYGTQRAPLEKACLDYLRKWYLFGWTYRDLMKDRPSISIPDDHDVYHGNIWGEGGKQADQSLTGSEAQDTGGYKMDAEWVKMVERTQTEHLPDPYDPTKVKQGIGVYYTE